MKLRLGFISNSSSSSFIITSKDNFEKAIEYLKIDGYDYYIFNDVMYTSFISDSHNYFSNLEDLASSEESGGHGYPYDEDNYIEVEGERGIDSVFIPKDRLTTQDYIKLQLAPPEIANKLYYRAKQFLNDTDIDSFIKDIKQIIEEEDE